MKRWLILVGVAMLAVGWQAAAQNDAEAWRLRVPTAEEYLAAVPSIMALGNQELNNTPYNVELFSAMTAEIYNQFPEIWHEKADQLHAAYLSFRAKNDYWYDQDIWIHGIILAWINQIQIDLSTSFQVNFLDFEISVIPRDFNAD